MSDDAKKRILARRAKFVAAAVAGIAIGCGKESTSQPCLSIANVPEDASTAQPCLSPPPQPCLSAWHPPPDEPPPRPCLSIAPPKRDAGSAKSKAGCDPPYEIDAHGMKRFKPECL